MEKKDLDPIVFTLKSALKTLSLNYTLALLNKESAQRKLIQKQLFIAKPLYRSLLRIQSVLALPNGDCAAAHKKYLSDFMKFEKALVYAAMYPYSSSNLPKSGLIEGCLFPSPQREGSDFGSQILSFRGWQEKKTLDFKSEQFAIQKRNADARSRALDLVKNCPEDVVQTLCDFLKENNFSSVSITTRDIEGHLNEVKKTDEKRSQKKPR